MRELGKDELTQSLLLHAMEGTTIVSISPRARAAAAPDGRRATGRVGQRLKHGLSFRNIGAVYVWALIIVIFTIWVPDTFPTWATVKQVLNGNAVTAMLALALVIPLCARVFDLSVAYVASLSGVTVAYFLEHGVSIVPAIALGLAMALLVGVINAFVVVIMRVDSFIGTLATGSLIQAFITMITNDIDDQRRARRRLVREHRAARHRRDHAARVLRDGHRHGHLVPAGAHRDRPAAVRDRVQRGGRPPRRRPDRRLRFVSLLASAFIAGIAGHGPRVDARLGRSRRPATPTCCRRSPRRSSGATQLRGGRFNAWGTLIAVLLIGTGIIGLGLARRRMGPEHVHGRRADRRARDHGAGTPIDARSGLDESLASQAGRADGFD